QAIDRERIVCRPKGALTYRVASTLVAPDGKVLDHRTFDPDRERDKSEELAARLSGSKPGEQDALSLMSHYQSDPYSLVCWAVARKCEDKPLSWPPPPNKAPLDNSERAARMNAEYGRMFVPGCAL